MFHVKQWRGKFQKYHRMTQAILTSANFQRETELDDAAMARLSDYVALLEKWNARINLVSQASLADVWRRHILDSTQLLGLAPADGNWLDLGSGAGLPGLVIALIGRQGVHLVESDNRKAVFLREAARLCDTPITVHRQRIEKLAPQGAAVISARALAPLPRLLPLLHRHMNADSVCLLLKGQDVEDELTQAAKSWIMRVERIQSRSDPAGVILKLTEVSDDRPNAARHGQG